MTDYIFPPELRTASIVPRWAIVWTTGVDTVASHTFFVTIYAYQIAKALGWKGPYEALMYEALVHDLDEVFTGDLVSPIKKAIIDEERSQEYTRRLMAQRLGSVYRSHLQLVLDVDYDYKEVKAIISAADRIDALLFLIVEQRRGNGIITDLVYDLKARTVIAWHDMPFDADLLKRVWEDRVFPALEAHYTEGGGGI